MGKIKNTSERYKVDLYKCKMCYSWIGWVNIILSNLIHKFNTIPIKILVSFLTALEKLLLKKTCYLKLIGKSKYVSMTRKAVKRKNWGQLALLDIKTYYKAFTSKAMCSWYVNWQIVQRNRLESPKIDSGTYRNLLYGKGISNHWSEMNFWITSTGTSRSHL